MGRKHTGFIGAWVGEGLKSGLQAEATAEHRSLSKHVTHILEEHARRRDAEREACARAVCRECRNGDAPRFDPSRGEFLHHASANGDLILACPASPIHLRARAERTTDVTTA